MYEGRIIPYLTVSESVLLIQCCSGDNIEKNEMGGACSAYGEVERCVEGFSGEESVKKTTWKTQAQVRGQY